jgi:Protein kinase domain
MLAPNTLLQDRYQVMRLLGQGGMGAVYHATDRKFGNAVALKETFYNDLNLRKAFSHEARLLNRLRHAALPVVTDYFAISDKQFLVMQYIPGKDLEQLLNERKTGGQGLFLASQVTKWADQLLDALEYLHSQKPAIIHRDIKPQNLKLTPRGEVILLDFGLAKGSVTHQSQESQSIRGYTPNYAPLEQIRGTGTDARSDIYSMGATLYHLLTGEMPPDALTRIASILMGQSDPLKQVDQLNPDVPPAVVAVVEKAMAPHPDQRYESAAMMRQALRNASQNVAEVGLHRTPTLMDEPMRKDAVAATALLTGHLPPSGTEALRTQLVEPAAAPPAAALDPAFGLLEEARQKLAGKEQEVIERRQTPKQRPTRNEPLQTTLDELPAPPARNRAVTLTGSRSRAIRYGLLATAIVLVTIGILAYRDRTTGQKSLPPMFWQGGAEMNRGGGMNRDIPIRVEALRYHLEITQSGVETRRETGLEPLQAGSKFKFHFQPRDGGYLYIIAKGNNGSQQTFLTAQPMPSSGVTSNWTDGGKDYQFPNGGQWFMIQPEAEATPFTVIFSPYQLQAPKFLREPSGKELTAVEQQELDAFRARYGSNKHELVAVADGQMSAVTVQVPADRSTPEPVMFDLALKRK